MKKKYLFVILFLFIALHSKAQFSKTHYIPPLSNSDLQEPHNQTMYISCPSITPINFQIQEIGGSTISGTVSRDNPYVYDIGTGFDTQILISSSDVGTVKNNKGYIVQAQDLVYVTVRLTSSQNENQAGGLVSKGNAALGTKFRIGAFVNTFAPSTTANHYTFATILATENNTEISFADIKPGVQLINNVAAGSNPANVILNAGESYAIAVQGPTVANKDGLIGASITSTKPVVVNCGSFAGSNGTTTNLDDGFDQIVSVERTGKEYIFIKGSGVDEIERPLIVANENGTDVFLNGSSTVYTTLNSGQYLVLDGSSYSANGNLYINTSKKVFAYQGLGGSGSQANQNMQFLPPLSCQTPKAINNIPYINQVGSLDTFIGTVCLVTKVGATLSFIIDGTSYTLANLPTTVNGPLTVTGNPNYVTYTFDGLTGNISVFSSDEVYLSYYGSSGAATYGGFYSGFTFKPEVTVNELNSSTSFCIPNSVLTVDAISNFDSFQWYFNNNPIPGATTNTYTPTSPGYYKVIGQLTGCPITVPSSDNIPVSSCPTDVDNDGVIDNIDLDNDNDGITNCLESFGNQNFNFTNLTAGTISVATYSNSYTGAVSTLGTGTPATIPVVGDTQGNFISETSNQKNDSVVYTLDNFSKPISISIEYPTTSLATDLLSTSTEIRITCPVNKTLTILNPNNQLLIDTNFDGIYESGVTQFSSFEIRFRLNGITSLQAGTGTFSIKGYLINSISIQNLNISDTNSSRVALHLTATCVPKDSDNDGVPDQIDLDSDNDGISDAVEAQGQNILTYSSTDLNQDGILDMFGTGIAPADSDNDGIPNYLDLDSDNDGIYDLNESGSSALDVNHNGIIDGNNFGTNGLANSVETAPDSGILNYTIADTDGDGIYNYVELDSDNDLCLDVIEAGFVDGNNDGLLGNVAPPTVNANGLVTSNSGSGYTTPNSNYIIAAPLTIASQPQNITVCELQTATFSVTATTGATFHWEVSIDNGTTWTALTNNAIYSGVTSATLTLTNVSPTFTNNQYRVFINKTGNSCGLYSTAGILTTYALPVITTPIKIKQCDDNNDGITDFNLTVNNSLVSSNFANETFTYYTTLNGATTQNVSDLISNPNVYTSANATIYVRVENANGCFRVATLQLLVVVTQIPPSFTIPAKYVCDDYVDAINNNRDGISSFDFSSITNSLLAILPNNVSIAYYKSLADFLAQYDAAGNSLAIPNPNNYRNIGYPNHQTIWVRVNSTVDNSCFGIKSFDIYVEALPFANPINAANLIRHCDDNHDGIYGFDTSTIQTTVLGTQTLATVHMEYFRANGTPLPSPLPNPFNVNGTETITIKVINNTTMTGGQPCSDQINLTFIVDTLPQVFPISASSITSCDDEQLPINQNGLIDFSTTTFQSTLVGTQTGMNVYYYNQNNVALSTPLPNPFTTGTQNVKVIIENQINTTCTAQGTIPFVVHPVPYIDMHEQVIICLPDTQATLDAGILDNSPTSAYTYQWYDTNGLIAGATSPTYTTGIAGNYYVRVTNSFGCTRTRNIQVIISQQSSIQNISVSDMTDFNSIIITASGIGSYQYSIDDINGPYRDIGVFENVSLGLHELYIIDLNGCGTVGPILIPVMGIPKFFTPNGDGINDTWNIQGITPSYASSIIYIFDRFGKLIKQISPLGAGWDGTYNGQLLPADDYWFTMQLSDNRNIKGHFTLKR